jgi:hypothetical protein
VCAKRPVDTGQRRQALACWIEARQPTLLVKHCQAAADVQRRGMDHVAMFDERELRGAAADVDVQNRYAAIVRGLRRAGPVRGEHRLHVMPRGGADEFTAHLSEHVRNRFRVFAAQRFPGQDHRACIDVVGMQACRFVGRVDDSPDRLVVDALLAHVWRKGDWRLEESLALHDEIAARQILGEAPQVDAREDHLCSGRADVDAYRHQLDVVLRPETRRRRVVLPAGVIVIVVVIRLAIGVRVHGIEPQEVVVERVPFKGVGSHS